MDAADYDAWYDTPRGRWIGETEFCLLQRELDPRGSKQLLDVGCGTGWFTRRMSHLSGVQTTGVDINREWLEYARRRDPDSRYVQGDALALPFADNSFDSVVSIAALCFTADWQRAVCEIVRVSRGRFVIGMLNRHSLLWRDKGRNGGSGAYRGAHWVLPDELLGSVSRLPVANARVHSAIFLPSGSCLARTVERFLTGRLTFGGFMVLAGSKSPIGT